MENLITIPRFKSPSGYYGNPLLENIKGNCEEKKSESKLNSHL